MYLSIDSIVDGSPQDNLLYSTEFLNSQTPSGLPLHRLKLKVGATIILLWNLNTIKGLCNGTRLIIRELRPNIIYAEGLSGPSKGQIMFIPRISVKTDTDLTFTFMRKQFPVRLAFAMTINKSQGQTLQKVGIFLPKPVFSHGQLYVAFSRATKKSNVKVQILNTNNQGKLIQRSHKIFTRNVVFKETF